MDTFGPYLVSNKHKIKMLAINNKTNNEKFIFYNLPTLTLLTVYFVINHNLIIIIGAFIVVLLITDPLLLFLA